MNKIINKTLKQELKYKGTTILTYKIQYPEITESPYTHGKEKFNEYNKSKAHELEQYCKEELFKEAIETYEYNIANGYPIMIYDIVTQYQITYNQNYIISLYNDQYIFTGGAHGNTIRTSQNWDLKIGKMIPLEQFYPNNPYFLLEILKQINEQIKKQIEKGTNQYFENYCQLVLETFNPQSYYLYPDHIEIFFQQYDIAPYSSGIPTFSIKIK